MNNTIIRSRAPLRIGLAGGGTDVSPYSDLYGGAILNATVSLYAHTMIEVLEEPVIIMESLDRGHRATYTLGPVLEGDDDFKLHRGVYNRLVADGHIRGDVGFRVSTFVDAAAGSGLGTSSTLVISILNAFVEWYKLPFGEYDLAHYAYEIERLNLGLAGGKQDQYAAAFGGFNFMEFFSGDKVIVNPLRIKNEVIYELETNLVLFFTQTNRESAAIIKEQVKNVHQKNEQSIEAMHQLKAQSVMMKEALLRGNVDLIGEILDFGFQEKKKMATTISNATIENIYDVAKKNGATGGKISGAGGGGFMIFYCPGVTKYKVQQALVALGGKTHSYTFTKTGAISWRRK